MLKYILDLGLVRLHCNDILMIRYFLVYSAPRRLPIEQTTIMEHFRQISYASSNIIPNTQLAIMEVMVQSMCHHI